MHRALALSWLCTVVACQAKSEQAKPKPTPDPATDTVTGDDHAGSAETPDPHAGHGADPHKLVQIPPPFDLKTPPADAVKTASGIAYKPIVEGTGKTPTANDGVKVLYTAWRQDGTTFATTEPGKTPTDMFLYETAGGFVEGMGLMKEGGKAMFWLPPDLAEPSNTKQLPEQLAYQVELIEVISAPPTPKDLAKPPADATREKSGVAWKKVKTSKGDKPRGWDKVSLAYTGWDHTGRLLESSEMHGKPIDIPVEGLPPVFADAVPNLAVGERARMWFPEKLLGKHQGVPTDNYLCFEVEVFAVTRLIEPPKAPPDVAAPPAHALKTPKGVSYVVLEAGGGGPHPKGIEKVKVNYTGWTTDGKRFDSSIPEGVPREFEVGGVVAGWTDVLLLMSVGDTWRIWIPEALAYKGAPQRPAGMLVFDLELIEIIGDKVQFTPPP